MDVRAGVFAVLAVLALLGIAIGAQSQHETFLHPDELANEFEGRGGGAVSGNITILTAFLVAAMFAAAALTVANVRWRQRALPTLGIFLGTLLIVLLVQTAMFNYDVVDLARAATFTISPVFANLEAIPSVFLGPIALLMSAMLLFQLSGARLLGRSEPELDATGSLRRFLGASTVVAPFLVIAALGNIRLLLSLPPGEAGAIGYYIVLPICALAVIGLLVIGSIKAWHLGSFVRNGRLHGVVEDAWIVLRRAEWAVAGLLIGMALLASLLKPIPLEALEAGRVFGVTVRTHTQSQVLLIMMIVPWLLLHRPTIDSLRKHAGHTANLDVGAVHPLVGAFWGVLGLATLGAGLTTFLASGAMWAWLAATLPFGIFAIIALRPQDGLLPTFLAAAILWSIGNTLEGIFELDSDSQLQFATSPGLLALFRVLAIMLVAWAITRSARAHTDDVHPAVAWPMTIALSVCVSMILFFQLPYSAWVEFHPLGEYVGIGTMVSSQDYAVRMTLHVVSGICAAGASFIVARILRPDWFTRSPPPLPVMAPIADA